MQMKSGFLQLKSYDICIIMQMKSVFLQLKSYMSNGGHTHRGKRQDLNAHATGYS
jgi:hypothetical protein